MRWTKEQVAAYESRTGRSNPVQPKTDKRDTPEKEIHRLISLECSRRGLIALHGSTAHRTHRTIGEPDFVVLMPEGKVLFVEVKTRSGRISEEQEAFSRKAFEMGHVVHIVRSFDEFRALL